MRPSQQFNVFFTNFNWEVITLCQSSHSQSAQQQGVMQSAQQQGVRFYDAMREHVRTHHNIVYQLSSAQIRAVIYDIAMLAKNNLLRLEGLDLSWIVDLAISMKTAPMMYPEYRLQEIANVFSGLGEFAKMQRLPKTHNYPFLMPLIREFYDRALLIQKFYGRVRSKFLAQNVVNNLRKSLNGIFFGIHHLTHAELLSCAADPDDIVQIVSHLEGGYIIKGAEFRRMLVVLFAACQPRPSSNNTWKHNPYPSLFGTKPTNDETASACSAKTAAAQLSTRALLNNSTLNTTSNDAAQQTPQPVVPEVNYSTTLSTSAVALFGESEYNKSEHADHQRMRRLETASRFY